MTFYVHKMFVLFTHFRPPPPHTEKLQLLIVRCCRRPCHYILSVVAFMLLLHNNFCKRPCAGWHLCSSLYHCWPPSAVYACEVPAICAAINQNSGSVTLRYWSRSSDPYLWITDSGCGSRRLKNIRIRMRIRNTAINPCCCQCFCCAIFGFLPGVPSDAHVLDAAVVVALYGVPVFWSRCFLLASYLMKTSLPLMLLMSFLMLFASMLKSGSLHAVAG